MRAAVESWLARIPNTRTYLINPSRDIKIFNFCFSKFYMPNSNYNFLYRKKLTLLIIIKIFK